VRVLSPSSPIVLAPPIPRWDPFAARDWASARRHPQFWGKREQEKG
jgi:hypothetical protein